MPRIERRAEVVWEGNVARGGGSISAAQRRVHGSPLLAGDANRQVRGQDEPRGAARGGARRLHHHVDRRRARRRRHTPGRIDVTLPDRDGRGRGPGPPDRRLARRRGRGRRGLDDAGLQAALVKADEGCPFSASAQARRRRGARRRPARLSLARAGAAPSSNGTVKTSPSTLTSRLRPVDFLLTSCHYPRGRAVETRSRSHAAARRARRRARA